MVKIYGDSLHDKYLAFANKAGLYWWLATDDAEAICSSVGMLHVAVGCHQDHRQSHIIIRSLYCHLWGFFCLVFDIIVVRFSLMCCFGATLLRAAVSQAAGWMLKLGILFQPGFFLHRRYFEFPSGLKLCIMQTHLHCERSVQVHVDNLITGDCFCWSFCICSVISTWSGAHWQQKHGLLISTDLKSEGKIQLRSRNVGLDRSSKVTREFESKALHITANCHS